MLRILALVVVSAALYAFHLDRVPAFLTLDEAHFSVHAHAIAGTGRNLNGDTLPLLISLDDPQGEPIAVPWGHTYYLPFGIYLIAGALQVLPLSETAVRLPSALLGGAVNVALLYFAALALFRHAPHPVRAAIMSAAVLAFSPANVIISRQAIDSVCQLPFTLGFLWCVGKYLEPPAPQPRYALAAGVILGAGIYAYVTSIVFMPFFLAVFWVMAWRGRPGPGEGGRAGGRDRRAWAWSLAGFALAVAPMLLWLLAHPDAFASIRLQYNRADPGSATLMETMAAGGLGAAVREFARIYWSYFDPAFLFVQGGNARTLSTGEAGVFLMPVALLAIWGLWQLRAQKQLFWLLIVLLLASPIPAAIKGTPYQIQRASGLLPIVSLLAGYGLAALWSSRRLAMQAAAAALAIVMASQFAAFYRDYLGDYRIRSGSAYDPTAFAGAAELIIAEDQRAPIAAVYLPTGFYDVGAKWRFYTTKHERPQLWRRTQYFSGDPTTIAGAAPGSLAVVPASRPAAADGWTTVETVRDLASEPTLSVMRRR
jgi:4-amino-4-deoxy-L-arabinose transferase-like glycosyltransferase